MKRILLPALCLLSLNAFCVEKYDLCVYGGTASGVVAAYSAAARGLDVVVVEPTCRIGGMVTGGLGLTDIGNKQVVKGVALQFFRKLGQKYGSLESWVFEPGAAKEILDGYLDHPRIRVLTGYHFCDASKTGTRIRSMRVAGGEGCADTLTFAANWFIDASYEGDLMAGAGVSYRTGREDNSEYGETWNGVELMDRHQFPDGVDPYVVPGKPESGLLWGIGDGTMLPDGTGDSLIQAYNYRICLTDSLGNSIPIPRPEGYDPSRYELLVRLFEAQKDKRGINDYFIWSLMPGRKTDINNRGGFSTDMIGMNHSYPEAGWEERQRIIKAHKDYTLGLLYFFGNDPRVPFELRDFVSRWGLPRDEYAETPDHWTPQLYIRECRRMVGEYVATQADCENRVTAPDGIAMAAYTMDSHNCRRIVVEKDGRAMVKNEGNVEIHGGAPYPISYRSLTPKRSECTNLLVPVCCSASHIAYGSIRMEPVFMCMGQAAGLAVAQAEHEGLKTLQEVDVRKINETVARDPYLDGSVPDILIDDPDARFEGDWKQVRDRRGFGPTVLKGGSGSVTYSAVVPRGGNYSVYTYQRLTTPGMNPVSVFTFSDGRKVSVDVKDVVVIGQTKSAWHHLGDVFLRQGEKFTVTLTPGEGTGKVYADALLLVSGDFVPGQVVPDSYIASHGSEEFFKCVEIPDSVFSLMQGKSYKSDCTVPRSELRYLTCLHRDASGRSVVGEMVVNRRIAEDVLDIFKKLYKASYPIERMRLIDNWEADDELSMRANNSSCFNFRFISHTTKVSTHGAGLAVDINPLYNPYWKRLGDGREIVEPATAAPYLDRGGDFPYKITRDDLCCRLFLSKGFSWGGDWTSCKDYQHFEKSLKY